MKQQISAFMDGELFDDEAEALLDNLKRDPQAHERWQAFHLISDVLRQPDNVNVNVTRAVAEWLKSEPTVLAPSRRVAHNARWFALSAAASVLAMALVAWMSVQVGTEPAAQIAMQQSPTAVRPASFSATPPFNDYLMAHQEYSPSTDVRGAASYIRTVAGQ
jgi:sigma-E factor negative regulatory protein RseA